MGFFDWYEPVPALHCPVCASPLSGWQGKSGPCALFVWRQGERHPVDQLADSMNIDEGERRDVELPQNFEIYTPCCGGHFFVEARCACVDGVWSVTELVTAENLRGKYKQRQDFTAHMRWLKGRARPRST